MRNTDYLIVSVGGNDIALGNNIFNLISIGLITISQFVHSYFNNTSKILENYIDFLRQTFNSERTPYFKPLNLY